MVNFPLTQVKRDLIRSALAVVEGNRQKERKKTKTIGAGVKEKKLRELFIIGPDF
jgi:hypothetical protein